MLQDSRIQSTVSFDDNGKRYGHLIAPNSTQRSGYGAEMIPIVVVRNGDGPGYLLTGGVHGDEYEGPIALMKVARDLDPVAVNGLVVIIPCLNLQAVVAASRLSPIDGSNLNRVFPGDRLGNFSEALADFVVRGIFPRIDFVSDLHAGGTSMEYVPLTMMHRTDDDARNAKSLDCMKAFGAPIALFSVDQERDGLLEWNAEIRGKIVVAGELGGGGRVTRLEGWIDAINADLPELKSFVLPGGTPAASILHLARVVCRRAERRLHVLTNEEPINPVCGVYLNRLSDLLFVMARAEAGGDEPLWEPATEDET